MTLDADANLVAVPILFVIGSESLELVIGYLLSPSFHRGGGRSHDAKRIRADRALFWNARSVRCAVTAAAAAAVVVDSFYYYQYYYYRW